MLVLLALALAATTRAADPPAFFANVPDCDSPDALEGAVACDTAAAFFDDEAACNCLTKAVLLSDEFRTELRARVCEPMGLAADADDTDGRCANILDGWAGFHNFPPDVEPELSSSPQGNPTNSEFDTISTLSATSWLDGGAIGDFSNVNTRLLSNWCNWRPAWSGSRARAAAFDSYLAGAGSDALAWSDVFSSTERDAIKERLQVQELPSSMKDLYLHLRTRVENEWRDTTPVMDGDDVVPPTVRRDLRAFTAAQLTAYQNAVQKTMDLGMFRLWNEIHAANGGMIHGGAAFLPAHSAFMRIYELALQVVGGMETGMPFGGWLIDFALPPTSNGRFRFSDVWSHEHGIGRYAHQRLDGETFPPNAPSSSHQMTPTDGTLRRSFRNVQNAGSFISPTLVWSMLGIGNDFSSSDSVEDSRLASCNIEGTLLHNGHHVAIGGFMGRLNLASYDPAFFMHHGFVDSIWRYWQRSAPSKDLRASIASYPQPENPDSFAAEGAHRAEDAAPFLESGHDDGSVAALGLSSDGPLTNGELWEYKADGPGAYRVVFPSAMRCLSDADCGVQAGVSRDEKRLYCSRTGFCAQYARDYAVCRSRTGSFLPCQNRNSRCQYAPSEASRLGLPGGDMDLSNPSASDVATARNWFCIPDPARQCYADWVASGKSTCGGDCKLVKPARCPYPVNVFGETIGGSTDGPVVEPPVDMPEPVEVEFDMMGEQAQTNLWFKHEGTLTDDASGLTATFTAAEGKSSVCSDDSGKTAFWRSTFFNTFGIACGGFLGKGEEMQVSFSRDVTLDSLTLTRFGSSDELEISFTGDGCPSTYTIDDSTDSTTYVKTGISLAIPSTCTASFVVPSSSRGSCGVVKMGVSYAGEQTAMAATTQESSGAEPTVTEEQATFCTGKPGGGYDACHPTSTCFISPRDSEGLSIKVQLAAGVCGPRDWLAEVTTGETTTDAGDTVPTLTYNEECGCDGLVDAVDDGADFFGTVYRENPDPFRAQDRLGGNQFTGSRKDKETTLDTASVAMRAVEISLAALAVLVAIVA